ncbi:MAG: hypothetical protein A2520_04705 [Deltaproteobacteria bacterium RIFOXYD12_FULL_53_23]|nr:MAG: hypothetical protein A2520_04705 [Deltaproteobacteria bacterium RIFOXYD12_FULL_53_23]
MNASKRIKYFPTSLVLATSLLLWSFLQTSAFSQNVGEPGMGGSMAGGPMMPGISISGKVLETMTSGGYTYVLLAKDGVKTWVAIPVTKVAVGDEITCKPGMVMSNFNSTSLNRSFERIVFSQGLASAGPVVAASAPVVAAPAAEAIKVDKAEGITAYTIGEIFAKKDALANMPVMVKARVVKISRGILGKNWLHLQDGTGSQATGTNDLMVTTDSVPGLGDVVTIKGNLSRDRDFGAGYRYDVIIEGAEVTDNK